MTDIINKHFEKMNSYDYFEVVSEEEKWYLVKYQEAEATKEKILRESSKVSPELKSVLERVTVLGGNGYGAYLVAFGDAGNEHAYSLDSATGQIDKTELLVAELLSGVVS